jgi:hypothetical protein
LINKAKGGVLDIDLDVINAVNKLNEDEAILYLRVSKDNVFIASKGTDGTMGAGIDAFIEHLDSEHIGFIEMVEDALEEYYKRNIVHLQ